MKQIKASVFFDILSYTFGNIIFVFLNLIIKAARVYKLRLAEANFLSCFNIKPLKLGNDIFIPLQTPRKKRTKKNKNIFHEMRTIRSPFLVLTFRTFVHENRTKIEQFLPTNNLVPNCEKCSQISNAVHEKAAIDAFEVYRNR